MPIPIRYVPDESRDQKPSSGIDYSFLSNYVDTNSFKKKNVTASNNDASLLFELWENGSRDGDNVKLGSGSVNNSDILRLKTKGLITGGLDNIKFTERGKRIIMTMALAEESKFQKIKQEKTYHEILASMDKRGKNGFRTA